MIYDFRFWIYDFLDYDPPIANRKSSTLAPGAHLPRTQVRFAKQIGSAGVANRKLVLTVRLSLTVSKY